jgi:opacity protein-like surface antigen
MSWTRFTVTLSAALLAGWTSCAHATDDEFGRSGPYLRGGGVYAFENFSGAAASPSGSWGYELAGGYRFNEYFALEVEWEQLLGFDDAAGDADFWMLGASGKFFPFHGIIQPFLLAGAGWASIDDNAAPRDSTGIGFRFGAGFDIYISRNWAFNVEAGYLLPIGSLGDYHSIPLSLGVTYRFY